MNQGPIVQASHLRVVLDAYRASDVDPQPDADRLGISIESADDPEAFVYEWPVWHFFEAGRTRIRPDFGFFAYDQSHVAAESLGQAAGPNVEFLEVVERDHPWRHRQGGADVRGDRFLEAPAVIRGELRDRELDIAQRVAEMERGRPPTERGEGSR